MKKLKDKLIRWLGGLTDEDFMLRTRPVISSVSRYSMETLSVCHALNPEEVRMYPEIMDDAHSWIAHKIADEMMEKKLIEFKSERENPDRIIVRATARIYRPEVES